MRMSHGHYPCSEKTHESPTNAPQTEQQESNQGEDGSSKRACQEAESATDGDSANDQTDSKANEQAQRDIEEFQSCQGKSRLDGQLIHCNLLAGCVKGACKHEGDQNRQQG